MSMSPAGWWAVGGFILVGGAITEMKERAAKARAKAGLPPKPPREPMMDLPGQWTAPVRAVTPRGVTARQSRCCPFGHQTPGKAAQHAASIRARIERTGR